MQPSSLVAVVVAALLAVGGCGEGAADTDEAPVAAPLPVDVRGALGSPAERAALVRSEQVLVRQCMGEAGLPYEIPSARDDLASDRWHRLEDAFQFGPPPDARGATFGLSAAAPRVPGSADDPNTARVDAMREGERTAWYEVLQGTGADVYRFTDADTGTSYAMPTDGCLSTSRIELYGSFGSYVELNAFSGRFAELVAQRVEDDEPYQRAVRSWGACARRLGFDMDQPGEPVGQVMSALEGGATDTTRELERRNFTMAVTCESEAHVYDLGWRLTEEALPTVLDQESGMVGRYRDALERAQQVLDDAADR